MGCHKLIDPVGFSFENFDGIGQFRIEDQGKAVDANAELTGTDVDGVYVGALELARRVGRSAQVEACVVTNWFRFTHARQETADDDCSLALLRKQFKESGGNVKKLLVSLTQNPAFQTKSAGGAQ